MICFVYLVVSAQGVIPSSSHIHTHTLSLSLSLSLSSSLSFSLSPLLSLSLSLSLPPSQVVDPPRDSNGDPAIDDSKPLLGDDDREGEEEGGGDIQLNARGFKIKLRFFNKEELGMSLREREGGGGGG